MVVEVGPHKKTSDSAADARPRSEAATLVFAVTAAVALGVACGFWINARLASAPSAGRAAPARPDPTPAAEPAPSPAGREEAPAPPAPAEPLRDAGGTADAGAPKTDPGVTKTEGRAWRRGDGAAAPAPGGAGPAAKADARPADARGVGRGRASAVGGQVRSSPCALYASAGALTLRGGGAVPLVLGGPGEAGRVNVSTPDWSNIAVLYEGRAGNGWLRYSVRSVGGRPGVYTVRLAAPCGSKTIPVTVTR